MIKNIIKQYRKLKFCLQLFGYSITNHEIIKNILIADDKINWEITIFRIKHPIRFHLLRRCGKCSHMIIYGEMPYCNKSMRLPIGFRGCDFYGGKDVKTEFQLNTKSI